ncbi:hypothetical protein, unlikely [Trypanosoma brucei brucei TREU927]|uniref:Uncharacterized protein n=1 Tax=Trypanosoma brucei brucei (strain 927/4 GUTat10.1) TaxID=185431 RepID=Q4GYI4_TRYB2|nr:hypothetical protein, unlikely [Trypanosoma brucei brucei TREU927]CAJ16600.1 hypothetical protein, unlikely [Trypanosoma brucei brucei TREU927]
MNRLFGSVAACSYCYCYLFVILIASLPVRLSSAWLGSPPKQQNARGRGFSTFFFSWRIFLLCLPRECCLPHHISLLPTA